MTVKEITYPSTGGQAVIHGAFFRPETEPRAVVQLVHGMSEYILRYSPMAEALCGMGFAVCGEDHLGHGQSMIDGIPGYFGKKGRIPDSGGGHPRNDPACKAGVSGASGVSAWSQHGLLPVAVLRHSLRRRACRADFKRDWGHQSIGRNRRRGMQRGGGSSGASETTVK